MSDWRGDGEPIPVQVGPSGDDGDGEVGRERNRWGSRRGSRPERRHRDQAGDADLAALVDDLEATLRQLRTEVGAGDPSHSRRPGGPALPRPPSPRELLTFTERYTIPTVVAFLEAAIRGLELLAGAIRLLDGRDPRSPDRRDRGGESVLADVSTAAGERAAAGGREALARVDDALAELQRTYEGDPEDPTARQLLADARELRAEIDDRLAALEPSGAAEGDDSGDGREDSPDRGPTVDVDAELASLKEQSERGAAPDDGGEDGDGSGD